MFSSLNKRKQGTLPTRSPSFTGSLGQPSKGKFQKLLFIGCVAACLGVLLLSFYSRTPLLSNQSPITGSEPTTSSLSALLTSTADHYAAHTSPQHNQILGQSPVQQAGTQYNASKPLGLPLWWFAPFYDESSFGKEASMYMLSLKREHLVPEQQLWISLMSNGCEFQLEGKITTEDHADLEAMLHRPNTSIPSIIVCHNVPWFMTLMNEGHGCQPCPPRGHHPTYTIIRAMAEADKYHPYSVVALNKANEVWVPTSFSQTVLKNSGVNVPIHVLPQGFNTTFFDPAAHAPATLPTGNLVVGTPRPAGAPAPFVFISVFKWEKRKGWDVLLAAYLREFSRQDNVELYIVTHAFIMDRDVNATEKVQQFAKDVAKRELSDLPRVNIISSYVSNQQLARLYRAANVFVLPTRGEGWGRPASEAMSMGLPSIITQWSGPEEFISQAVGYPLEFVLQPAEDNGFIGEGAKWAEPSEENLRQHMRRAFQDPGEAARKGRAARELMLAKYSPRVVAEALVRELQRVELKVRGGGLEEGKLMFKQKGLKGGGLRFKGLP